MSYEITTAQHPKTAEHYAVAVDEDGKIIEAAGPLYYKDPTDEDSLYGWLANSFTAKEDGEWLQAEIDRATGNA